MAIPAYKIGNADGFFSMSAIVWLELHSPTRIASLLGISYSSIHETLSQVFILNSNTEVKDSKVVKSEQQWRRDLDASTYHVCREKGTERAFTGKYWNLKEQGMYRCAACGEELFSSETKYDSGSGWPSFYKPAKAGNIVELADRSHGMVRTEVICGKCDSHLGHLFPDGPEETGLRYCINSASLQFEKK